MKIEESSVRLDASHSYARRQEWESDTAVSFREAIRAADAALEVPPEKREAEDVRRLLQDLVAAILAVLSGQKCRDESGLPEELPAPARRGGRVVEWQTRTREHLEEHERTTVSASGEVRTADGRTIAFDMALAMCRDFSCTRESVEQGRVEFKDPLVVNFAGKAAALSDKRFCFDLDADGNVEEIPELAAGSAYLCFDTDRDGRIADGRELFGATGAHAGDGFADLARLDADGNGWIDESDPAYAALGVWFPDGKIQPLKEAGVGALNLASAWSPFALRDGDNRPLGQIWRSGVYLHEDGRVGSLQQIDLGVLEPGGSAGGDVGKVQV